ncbi:MAG: uracil-DNA glycosylase [Rickettsiales bacterium]|nr:uracil-DNA glycosylase [Rickettsiales bacterium]|tara:strand:+ start:598 stop:1290 length:693 start_codon:yes stop_codon:yes gene_type:complete
MNFKNKENLNALNKEIVECNKCERLVLFRNKIAKDKRKMYCNETYWGRPVTGFGDINARLLIIGLAPAAHGGNRTGRVFTGDKSSEFLFDCLGAVGISNQNFSLYKNDNLKLHNSYLTLSLKCVPPNDKPTSLELKNCYYFFREELNYLKNVKTILTLGKVAFDSIVNFYKKQFNIELKGYKFAHGAEFVLPDKKKLVGCYHPSPRNVNTGRIDKKKFISLIKKVLNKLK